MKYFSKLMAAVLTLSMLWSGITAMAEEGKVEISFCVGDETLMINGEAVTVEKPYVVGEGVTLVPLRVITEAFGATVEWEQETKTVYLTYPDVNIVLQIANPVAEVNGRAEQLLAAPELTNSVTMVPLRFISETFGAEVGYEPDTRQITVVKTVSEGSSTVIGAVDNQYVGDSYYGWSIENPKDMPIDYCSFDGSYLSFTDADYNYIEVMISPVDDDYDFEKDYISTKNSIAEDQYTLVKADKDTSNPKLKTMHFQAKDKYEFVDMRMFLTEKYTYILYGSFDAENAAVRDECVRIMSTFTCSYNSASDIYDLSNVENGFRKFTAEAVDFSFNVPANFYMASSEDAANQFAFYSNDVADWNSAILAAVYSKSDVESAQSLANKDYTHNKNILNEDITTFATAVVQRNYNIGGVYQYEYTVNGDLCKHYTRDVFFELGEYVYNISISIQLPDTNQNSLADAIMNSVEVKELDADEVGILMRNFPEATGTFKSELGNATLDIPNNYTESAANGMNTYVGPGAYMTVMTLAYPNTTFAELKAEIKDAENSQKEQKDTEIVAETAEVKLGDNRYYTYVAYLKGETETTYMETFATIHKSTVYMFMIAYPEDMYSESNRAEVREIISSMSFD